MSKTFGTSGAILAALLVCTGPAEAIIGVDSTGNITGGQAYFAKETAIATAAVSTGVTGYVASMAAAGQPGARRLTIRHPFNRRLNAGESATITYNLTNMAFHGATQPTLTLEVEGSNAAVSATRSSGGAAGDSEVVFTLAATSSTGTLLHERTLLLEIRALRIDPDNAGDVRVRVEKNSNTNPDWTLEGVARFQPAGVLRESASPVTPTASFGTGSRTFVEGEFVRDDGLAASVGSLSFSVSEGSHVATSGASVAALSDVIASAAITFSGDFSFASDVFLSTAADCSSTSTARADTTVSGNDRTSTVDDANGKHLCIEVNGTTPIPEVGGYTAAVDYTGLTSAVAPPGDTSLTLGGIEMGGSVVNIPYVTLNSARSIHRLQVYNRMNEPAPYRIDFRPPEGTTANPSFVEGTLPPGNTSFRVIDLTTLTGQFSRTALTLTVDAPPELLQVQTIQINVGDRSTDTVNYQAE